MSSPQFRLLVACAGWPRGSDRDEAVRRAWEDAGPDWSAFLAMVRRHRMASLALDGLTCAGIEPPPAGRRDRHTPRHRTSPNAGCKYAADSQRTTLPASSIC